MTRCALSLGLLLLAVATFAEEPSGPTIVATGAGEIRLSADRAVLDIGVETRDSTAAGAAASTHEALAQIKDALAEAGISADSLPSSGYSVEPDYDWEEGRLIGYAARSGVTVTVDDFAQLGPLLDAVLKAGANDIPDVRFETSQRRTARDEALKIAVKEARHDAEILAEGGGGRLGALLELSTSGDSVGGMERIVVSAELPGAAGLQLSPPEVVVKVRVQGTWRFIPEPSR